MSNRIIKHSSRYKGPAGDSRPWAEIEADMIAREEQASMVKEKLIEALNEAMWAMTLSSHPDRVLSVWDTVVEWRTMNDLEFKERIFSKEG